MRWIFYYIWRICYSLDNFFLKLSPQYHFLSDRKEGLPTHVEGVPRREDWDNGGKETVAQVVAKQMIQAGITDEKETEIQ